MRTPWLEPNTFAVFFFGVAVPIVGLLALLTRPTPRRRLLVLVAALILVVVGAGLALAGQPEGLWAPPVLLALLGGASLAVGSQRLGRVAGGLAGVLRRPGLHAAFLVAAGPALAFGWIQWIDPIIPLWDLPVEITLAHEPVRLRKDVSLQPVTDAGRPVPMYRPADAPPSPERLLEMDTAIVAARELTASVIRTAPGTQDYNCHGWVFGDGRGWIQGAEVEDILRDNGYYAIHDPRPGDVAIYRNFQRQIAHSAVVRTAAPGGPVLIESKWGKGGRFVSGPDGPPYGADPTYYRSPRRGNRLHGLGSEGPDGPTTAETMAIQEN